MNLEVLNNDDRVSLADFLGEAPAAEDEKFVVDTTDKAEWCLQKAGEAARVIAAYEAERDRLIQRLAEVCDEKTKDARETVVQMAYLLDPWARSESERIKKKTIPLVNGEVKIQSGRESLVVDSMELLEAFQNSTGKHVVNEKVVKTADKMAIKKLLKEVDVIPGVHAERGDDKIVMIPKVDDNALPDGSR